MNALRRFESWANQLLEGGLSSVLRGRGGGYPQPLEVAPSPPPSPALALQVNGRRVALEAGRTVTIGRALDNDVIVDDSSCSRHHARIVPRSGHWLLEDQGSSQGSFVNNRRVAT